MSTHSRIQQTKYKAYSRFYYKGKLLYWILLSILIVSLISLPFIKVDVSVQSRGLIKTISKQSPIASAVTAKVNDVKITENLTVSRGDTLVLLEQNNINSEINIAIDQMAIYERYISDINKMVSSDWPKHVSTPLYSQELMDYKANYKKLARSKEQLKLEFNRTRKLYNEGVLPIAKLEEDSFKLRSVEDDLMMLQTKTLAEWELDKKNYTIAINELNVKVENLKELKNQYVITAPYNGSIISFNGIAKGSIVNENEVIAMISPEDDLLAECYISPSDIGLIRSQMPVRIQIDAYNYNQWGLMEGTVVDISHDVTEHNGKFAYVVKSQMKSKYLQLSNGIKGQLKKGMSITGRFIVNRRSLYQLLFDDVNDWLNPQLMDKEE